MFLNAARFTNPPPLIIMPTTFWSRTRIAGENRRNVRPLIAAIPEDESRARTRTPPVRTSSPAQRNSIGHADASRSS